MKSDTEQIRQPLPRWDALFSIIVGVFLILMLPRIWQIMLLKNDSFSFTDESGNPLAYTKTIFFPGDVAMALFSVALIIEGLVLMVRRTRPLLVVCLAVIVLSTLANLGFVIYMMQKGYGFQLMSGLATAFGIYIAGYQWSLLKRITNDAGPVYVQDRPEPR